MRDLIFPLGCVACLAYSGTKPTLCRALPWLLLAMAFVLADGGHY